MTDINHYTSNISPTSYNGRV